ncbi:MAG: hypothetical protein ACYTGX_18895 [Planctomycetota bacterium]
MMIATMLAVASGSPHGTQVKYGRNSGSRTGSPTIPSARLARVIPTCVPAM